MRVINSIMSSFRDAISKHKGKIRLSVRITVSALAAFAVNTWLQLPQGYWIAFTAILVVQASVGGSVKAVVERMMGTFAGAAYGAFIASVWGHLPHEYYFGAIIAGIAPISFIAALYPSFRIAPITVAIVLFSDTAHNMSPLVYAEHRVMEIGVGCLIGLVVSLTVLPSRAHRVLAVAASTVLGTYADLLTKLLDVAAGKLDYTEVEKQHADIRAAIGRMELVGEDATRERKSKLTDEPDPDPILRMIRRLRFDLVMIGRAVMHPMPPAVMQALTPPLSAVATESSTLLRMAAATLSGKPEIKVPESLEIAYGAFGAAMAELHRTHALATLTEGETGRVFTLSFSLEQLHQNLRDLVARANEFGGDDDTVTTG